MVDNQDTSPIHAERVRYIKLGEQGKWERECREKGTIRFGFDSATAERFAMCIGGRWDELKESFVTAGKNKGTATRFTNETQLFFEDKGSILWMTFMGQRLYWGFLDATPAKRHEDGDGVWRKIKDGWRSTDLNGEQLTKDRLSGALTKLAMYRGTSCDVDVAEYVVRRINGQKIPQVERALVVLKEMQTSVAEMMKLLEPRDFETLIDLVFSTSGWRRQGRVGGVEKTLDLDLLMPTTGERAFVQVKSSTNAAELAAYVAKLEEIGIYDWMFFVYHSGEVATDDERVILVGPEKLAEMVVDTGLINWLIRKVS